MEAGVVIRVSWLLGSRDMLSSYTIMEEGDRFSGIVIWFNGIKGYGFITPCDGDENLFVQQTSTRSDGFRGECAMYRISKGDDGRIKVVDVSGPESASVQGSARGVVVSGEMAFGKEGDRFNDTANRLYGTKGFGFIFPIDGGEILFVHQSSIRSDGFRSLTEGENVEYHISKCDKAVVVSCPDGATVQGSAKGVGFINRLGNYCANDE